jgi:hypothetical protein
MPITITETDTYTADVIVPEEGDARTAASLLPSIQALANRTKNLLGKIAGLGELIITESIQ